MWERKRYKTSEGEEKRDQKRVDQGTSQDRGGKTEPRKSPQRGVGECAQGRRGIADPQDMGWKKSISLGPRIARNPGMESNIY